MHFRYFSDSIIHFYPYEVAHAVTPCVSIEDKDLKNYKDLEKFLDKFEILEYVNSIHNDFHPVMDNKVTIGIIGLKHKVYISYWDNVMHISADLHLFDPKNAKYCVMKTKSTRAPSKI